MKQLIETIEKLRLRNIGFRSLAGGNRARRRRKACWSFTCSARWPSSSVPSFGSEHAPDLPQRSAQGAPGGRPPKLTGDSLDVARTLLANPDIPVSEVADRLGVSPATLYRYLPAAKAANSPSPGFRAASN